MDKRVPMSIKASTKERLVKRMHYGETFDDAISALLDIVDNDKQPPQALTNINGGNNVN